MQRIISILTIGSCRLSTNLFDISTSFCPLLSTALRFRDNFAVVTTSFCLVLDEDASHGTLKGIPMDVEGINVRSIYPIK